jgi:glycosyltransferase involved in cell wall biosynthesis
MSERALSVEISAVVPVGMRHADISELFRDYKAGFEQLGRPYEIIFVLDGAHAEVAAALDALRLQGERIVIVTLTKSFGEATALMAGFERARGATLVTLPAYFQIESRGIAQLVQALGSSDVAIACRWPRAGGPFEALRRTVFHRAVRLMTGFAFNDLGCGARALKRRVVDEIFLYGDQHRFMAVLAHRQGFRVTEVRVAQSPKDRFEGRYRVREYAHRALDIMTVLFLVRFTKKPLRFFGMVGLLLAGVGMLLLLALLVARIGFDLPLADRPALLLSSLLLVLGLQLFALGLLGELIIFTHARDIKDYQVESVIHFAERNSENSAPAATRGETAAG